MREPTAVRPRPTAMTSRAPTRLLMALVVAALGLAPGLLLAGPAYACSCAQVPLPAQVAAADVLVVGEVDSLGSADRSLEVTIAVEQVVRGDVEGDTTQIRTADSGAACGLDFLEVGQRYAFFAARATAAGSADEPAVAGLCGGTTSLRPGLVEELERLAADAPPVGAASTGGEAPPPPTADEDAEPAEDPGVDPAEDPAPGLAEPSPLLIGLVVAGTLLVGAGAVAWWRRRRT